MWYALTGQSKMIVQDLRLKKPERKLIQRSDYNDWVRETDKKYEEELEARINGEVEFVWCLVGNIIGDHPVGEDKLIMRGTKHFSTGTKVYCFPPQWGDGYEKIYVMGRPRKSFRFIKVVIRRTLVTNWRIQKVFAPQIKREMAMNNGWDDTDESKKNVEALRDSLLMREGILDRMKKIEIYLAQNDFQPELQCAKCINERIAHGNHLTIREAKEIVMMYNDVSRPTGSGWLDYQMHLCHLLKADGFKVANDGWRIALIDPR